MKTLVTLFLLSLCFRATAQRSSNKHVTTDGRQLHIRIDMEQAGRSVHFNRSFDVADMNQEEVSALENHVVDSLNRVMANQSTSVAIDRKYTERARKAYNDAYTMYSSTYPKSAHATVEANASSTLPPSEVTPTSVLIREDKENGRLWMQYTIEKDGEALIIERTANIIGKTEREKQAIIKETERSFGIKLGNQ